MSAFRFSRLTTLFLLSAALPGCDSSDLDADLGQLQGTWYSISTEWDGVQQAGENRSDLHVIEGRRVIAKLHGEVVGESLLTLEPSRGGRKGKITFEMKAGNYTGKTWVGRYEVDSQTARWCGAFVDENPNFPAAFATTSGDKLFIRTMRRVR